jgi:hypothetical protein
MWGSIEDFAGRNPSRVFFFVHWFQMLQYLRDVRYCSKNKILYKMRRTEKVC